jgi:hypothetical protein
MTLVLSFAIPSHAHGGACGCSSLQGTGLAGPIITVPAYGMQPGTTSVSLGLGFHNSGRIAPNDLSTLIKNNTHADDNYGSISPVLAVSHGFTDKFSMGISLPFIISLDFREVHDGLEQLGDSIGFGDLMIMSKYKFYDNHRFQSALLAGLELPTGATKVVGDTGERFEALNQPGSGSFDPLFGIAFSKQFDKFGLDSNFLYKLATEGAQDTVTGDLAYYNIALSYAINHDHKDQFEHHHIEHDDHSGHGRFHRTLEQIFPEHVLGKHLSWDLILEANTLWQEAPEVAGETIPNHGGTTVYLSPGLRMVMNDSWVYNLTVSLPVIQALNGLQGGSDMQVSFSVATSF